jgi:hypothetical protein
LPSHRRRGCGTRLLRHILNHAAEHFRYVVLRTETSIGDRFYQACGFTRISDLHDLTHRMMLPKVELRPAPECSMARTKHGPSANCSPAEPPTSSGVSDGPPSVSRPLGHGTVHANM